MNTQVPIGTIIPETNSAISFQFKGVSDLTNWKATRHGSGQRKDPVCNDIFKNAGSEKCFEVEKVEHDNYNSIHLNYSNFNESGSNKINSNHAGSQADSNHVIFDTANTTAFLRDI